MWNGDEIHQTLLVLLFRGFYWLNMEKERKFLLTHIPSIFMLNKWWAEGVGWGKSGRLIYTRVLVLNQLEKPFKEMLGLSFLNQSNTVAYQHSCKHFQYNLGQKKLPVLIHYSLSRPESTPNQVSLLPDSER